MVRIDRVPVQRSRNGVPRDAGADDIRSIRALPGMDRQVVVDRRVGGDDDRIGAHMVTLLRAGTGLRSALNIVYAGLGKDAAALRCYGVCEPVQVLDGMELGLVRKAQTGTGVEALDGRALDPLDPGNAGPPRRFELPVQFVELLAGRNEQESIEPGEVAANAFPIDDLLDDVDCLCLALARASGAV